MIRVAGAGIGAIVGVAAALGGAVAQRTAVRTAPPVPAYAASQFACASYDERVRTEVRAESGGRSHLSTVSRDGVWLFTGEPAGRDVALEGWYDSLKVERVSGDLAVRPDADGVLGGRFRGTLSPDGRYTTEARPFVPDAVAEIVRLDRALDELFPRLPTRPLRVGESWHEPPALQIRRLADSADASGRPLWRYAITDRANGGEVRGDSIQLEGLQQTDTDATLTWSQARGLEWLDRRVTVTTQLPPTRTLSRAVRTLVTERQTLTRRADTAPGACGR
jgi:hypothetical protein